VLVQVLTPAQQSAVEYAGGPLLILGGPGTGKTRVLVERFRRAPEGALLLAHDPLAADRLRDAAEGDEATVTTFGALCAQLLRDEAVEARVDPFATPVSPADRLAMLLERIDDLPLRLHDLRGNPSGLLGSIVQRIDRLKDELISAEDYAAWAATLRDDGDADRARAAREREFAEIYLAHDRLLAESGTLDHGDLVLLAFRALRDRPHVRARTARRWRHILVDDFQDLPFSQGLLLRLLAAEHGNVAVAADDDQAIRRLRGAARKNLQDFRSEWPQATELRLERSFRLGAPLRVAAAAMIAGVEDREPKALDGPAAGELAFWCCTNDRAQAQAVAADVERLMAREDVAPEEVCVLVRSVRGEGQAVGVALEERAVPYTLVGAAAFFGQAEVRDIVAWLRLLADPGDAGAVVRQLAGRPSSCARSTSRASPRSRAGASSTWSGRSAPRSSRRRYRRRRASASSASSSSTGRPAGRSTRPGPTSTCTGSSSGSGCAASCCSRPRPRSSNACTTSRASASSPPPTRSDRRRPQRASSRARSPRSPTRACARTTSTRRPSRAGSA
jgi:DNA helicase II / ATP-dependent DNA helicase PcrA